MDFQTLQSPGTMKWGPNCSKWYWKPLIWTKIPFVTYPTKLKLGHVKTLKVMFPHSCILLLRQFYTQSVPSNLILGSFYNKNHIGYQTAKFVRRGWENRNKEVKCKLLIFQL
jgi:hypothetical protein